MALSAANEASLKNIINQSTLDSETKRVLVLMIDALAGYNQVAGDLTPGATGTLGTGATVKNGLVVTLGT